MIRQKSAATTAEENGKWLTENCFDDKDMRGNVRSVLSKIYTPVNTIEAKLNERKSRLENAVMCGQEFDKSFSDISDRVNSLEYQVERQKPICVEWNEIVKDQQEQKILVKEVVNLKPLYSQLIATAEKTINSLEPGKEKDATQERLDNFVKLWEKVTDVIQHRDDVINQLEAVSRVHNDEDRTFKEWIVKPEETLKELEEVPTSRDQLFKYKKLVKEFVVDVEDHIPKHSRLNESCSKLECSVKKFPDDEIVGLDNIKEELTKTNDRLEKLSHNMANYKERVESLQLVLVKYYDHYSDAEKIIDDIEKALEYQPTYGVDEELGKKELKRIDDLIKLCDTAKENVDMVCDDSKDLEGTIDKYDGDNAPVKESTRSLVKRFKDLQDQCNSRKGDIEKKNKVLDQFLKNRDVLEKFYMAATQKLVSIGSVKPTPEQVKEQLNKVNELEEELQRMRPQLQALKDASQWLIDNNADDRVASGNIKNQLASAEDPFNELAEKINDKQNLLQASLLQTQEFQDTFNNTLDSLAEYEIKISKCDPLSMKFDKLWKQDEDFRAFEADVQQMEPIFEQLIKSGKKVKEAAEEKEEKDDIDNKMKDIQKRKKALEEKIKDRRDNIDKLLPEAKEEDKKQKDFKPLLEALEDKCQEAKEAPKTLQECKKQLEYVKHVTSQIEETKPKHKDMNVCYDKEKNVASTIPETSDEQTLDDEIANLNKRWDALQVTAHAKEDQVTKLHFHFVQYEDCVEPLLSEIKKIEDFLEQPKRFGLDIAEGKKILDHVSDLLKELDKTQRKVDDVNRVGKDLTDQLKECNADPWQITTQLNEINRRFENIKNNLRECKEDTNGEVKLVDQFLTGVDDCQAHLDDVTSQQEKFETLSTEPNKVKEQLAEVDNLLDELEKQKPKLEKVDQLGENICKNNPDDFSVSTETKFKVGKVKEPTERCIIKLLERKSKLQNLLVGSQELQDTLDDFNDKLTDFEKSDEKMKPVSAKFVVVKKQETVNEQVLDDISQLQPSFKLLEKTAEKILKEAEPKEKEQLTSKINNLKTRWEESLDKLKKRRKVISKVLPLAHDYYDHDQEFGAWLSETEKKIVPSTDDLLVDREIIQRELDRLKIIKKDIDAHKPDYEAIISVHKPLVTAAEDDVVDIEEEVKKTTERWVNLNTDFDSQWNELNNICRNLDNVDEQIAPVEEFMTQCEQTLEELEPVGDDKEKAKNQLDKLDVSLKKKC